MQKIVIKFDNEKIKHEKKYSVEQLENRVDGYFSHFHFPKKRVEDGLIIYNTIGRKNDFGAMGRCLVDIAEEKYLVDNMVTWLWMDSDGSSNEKNFVYDDALERFGHKESVLPWK